MAATKEKPVNLSGVIELLHDHLNSNLCRTVFNKERTTEREKK